MQSLILPAGFAARLFTHLIVCVLATGAVAAQGPVPEPREDRERELERYDEVLRRSQSDEFNRESGEDPNGRSFWFEFQRRFPFDVVPAGAHKRAIQQMHATSSRMEAAAEKSGSKLFAANIWSEVGPTNVGGRVRAFALHPRNSSTMYLGGASGGVWKSVDGGATWRTTFDKQTALTIGAIAIDPQNPSTVYVGTGELRVASDIGYLADGVFKSTDGGDTWRNIGLNNLSAVVKIIVHKDNPNILYLASGRLGGQSRYQGGGLGTSFGFYRSTDAGETWSQVQTVSGSVFDAAVNPVDNNEVFITTNRVVARSRDAGATFTNVSTGIANLGGTIRMSLAVDPTTPTRLRLLQAYIGAGGQVHVGQLYTSTNSGTNWTSTAVLDQALFRFQGDYNNCIGIDPSNSNNILVGGIDLWRSTNGGTEFTNVTRTFAQTGDAGIAHPDHHIIVFDPGNPTRVFIGNDGGVYRSTNSGASFTRLHAHLPITQFHTVEIDQTRPYRVYGGTQDNQTQGGFGSQTAYNKSWQKLLGGDGFWVVVDHTNPDIVYAEYQYGALHRIDVTNLTAPPTNLVQSLSGDGGGWSAPTAMSKVDGKLYHARSKVYRNATPRGTISWETLDPGYSRPTRKSSALSLSPFDANKIIVGNEEGDVRFSLDGGASWAKGQGTPARFATDLMFDPIDRNRVYATFAGFRTGHVFVSNNNGATFTNISSNLPDVPVNAIEIDPVDNTHLFVGTDIGVYASLDAGATWIPFNASFPVVPVADMKIHRTRRVLVAATHGRSMFDVGIDNITIPAMLLSPVGGETFATPGEMTVKWAGFNGPVTVLLSSRSGQPFTAVATGVTGTSASITLPAMRSTTARVRVESVSGGQVAASGNFTLSASSNIETLGSRGFVAEAIALRRGQLWATARASDTIYRLNVPLLTRAGFVVRSGFSGTVRDLAYDAQGDVFYALVTENDFSSPRIYRLDTTGAMIAALTLPASLTAASGIDIAPTGLAVATPGTGGRIVIIDVASGSEVASSPYVGVRGDWRRGLIWNGTTYTQGVVRNEAGLEFPSEIQQLRVSDSAHVFEVLPVVVTSGQPVYFFDLAVDNTQSTSAIYYATDTAGVFYRFQGELFSGIETSYARAHASGVTLGRIAPNPVRTHGIVELKLARAETLTIDLMTPDGARASRVFDGRLDAGTHARRIDTEGLSSGVYYLVVTTTSGDRAVTPVAVMR